MNKRFTAGAIVLLIILIIRTIMQLLALVTQNALTAAVVATPLVVALFYVAASIGIVWRKRWGAIIAMLIGGVDLFSALALGGSSAIGAGIVDVLILFLAYRQFKVMRTAASRIQI